MQKDPDSIEVFFRISFSVFLCKENLKKLLSQLNNKIKINASPKQLLYGVIPESVDKIDVLYKRENKTITKKPQTRLARRDSRLSPRTKKMPR